MRNQDRTAILALAAAGVLWGLTVPLSKLALGWLDPSWLTFARFAAAAPLLAVVGRNGLREALLLRVAAAGALGFGAVIVLQNLGLQRTSVSHAAVLVGGVPVLVALIGAGTGGAATRRLAWIGYAIALVGVVLVAGSGGGGNALGDLLVFASVALSAVFIVVQPRLLAGRDAAAVTAVQFAAGALVALPIAVLFEGAPAAPTASGPMLAFVALALVGTLLPFWLFAFGQARVTAELAGAFVNLEPVVGAALGWLAFGDAATIVQLAGALAVLVGIAMSTLPSSEAADERRSVGHAPPQFATASA
jgi:drug/metabolite transporter (DMT)-like permease